MPTMPKFTLLAILVVLVSACGRAEETIEKESGSDAAQTITREAEVLREFASGTFLENLARGENGDILVTSYFDRLLLRLARSGEVAKFAQLPAHPVGILVTEAGFIVTAHATPFTDFPAFTASNRVLLLNVRGEIVKDTPAPKAQFLNGLTKLPTGEILAADSIAGVIWQIDPVSAETTVFLADPQFAPDPDATTFRPGANGLKVSDGALYISNSSRGTLLRRAPAVSGSVEVYARPGPVDDFTFDKDGSVVATTHGDQLIRIMEGGAVISILDNGCDGCTSVIADPAGRGWIVLTTGGLLEGQGAPARILLVRE
jgi:hypothetical protein